MPALSAIQTQLKEHEEWLIGLRRDPCMTLAKIRIELDNQKGVKATPHQLETYFRNLGQRKNLSRRDWIAVFRALDSQKTFGRRYRLFLSGKEIEERELQKKRKNAKPAQPLVETLTDADRLLTQLPDGVTVERRLPPGSSRSQQHSITPQSMSHASSVVNPNSEARTLLDNILASSDPVAGLSSIRYDTGQGSTSIGSRLASTASASQSSLQIVPVDIAAHPFFEPRHNFGNFEMYNGITFSFPASGDGGIFNGQLSPGASLPSLQSSGPISQNDCLLAEFNHASPMDITLDDHIHCLSSIDFARLPVLDVDSTILSHEWHESIAPFLAAKDVFEGVRSLMLIDDADGDFSGLFDVFTGPGVFTDQNIQLLLFSIVNNFAGLDGTPAKDIIKLIHQHEPLHSRILHHIATGVSIFSSRAMVEKLLEAAIEAGESKTVHDLLVLDMVRPDDIVFFEAFHYKYKNERRLTAVEKASKLRHFHIVGDLLRFGADVNKSHEKDGGNGIEQGALECAIGVWGEYHPIDINTVELLLSNGATVSGRLMEAAIRWGDEALVEKLMSRIPPSEHVYLFCEAIGDAAEYLRNDLGLKFVRQAMQACRDMHNNECIDLYPGCLAEVMCKAARRNNHDLVDLLLPHGGQKGLDMALAGAARFGNHTLVRWLLEHGARANGKPCELDHESFHTTPLAEAIRRGDDELVALFAKEGAWDQIGEPDRLEATMRAIGESLAGSRTYLLQVLNLVPNPDSRALSFILVSAIKAGHEEVALALLEAIAAPDSLISQSPLIAALKVKSQTITWAILDSGIETSKTVNETALEAAVAWGDLEIIKALFFMRLHEPFDASMGSRALSLAIKAGNKSVIDLMIKLGADYGLNSSHGGRFHGVDLLGKYRSPLSAAALVRDAGTADYLLDHGASPADEPAIINAIAHDRMLLNLILQRFRQRYPQGNPAFGGGVLIYVLKTHDEEALDMCLRAGFDVNNMVWEEEAGQTAVAVAVKNHHSGFAWITKLLDAGGDVNLLASVKQECPFGQSWAERFSLRQTVLLDAIETRNLSLVELLISRGAHVQKEAKLGLRRTPLQKACEVGSHPIVDLLLKHNADVNEAPASRWGATALQLAAKAGSLRIARKLLDLGAILDAPGVQFGGHSAIEYAAEYGRLHMILFLCNAADGKLPADQYKSAIALAQEKGHKACADLLTELSAKNQAVIDASGG